MNARTSPVIQAVFPAKNNALGHISQQAFIRYVQALMQAFYHFQAQGTLVIQHFRDSSTAPDKNLQVFGRQPLLLHPELDGFNRIGRRNRVMLVLIGLDQGVLSQILRVYRIIAEF